MDARDEAALLDMLGKANRSNTANSYMLAVIIAELDRRHPDFITDVEGRCDHPRTDLVPMSAGPIDTDRLKATLRQARKIRDAPR